MPKIHRVGVAVKDLETAIPYYTALFGATFVKTGEAVSQQAGVKVAADWALGVELVEPIEGSSNPIAQVIAKFLAEKGDGVVSICFSVDDMQAAIGQAKAAGAELLLPTFAFTDQQLQDEFDGAFSKFEETVLDTVETCGVFHSLNVIVDA